MCRLQNWVGPNRTRSTQVKRTRGKQQATPNIPNFGENVAIFNVRLVVPPYWKPIDEDIKMCQTMLNIPQDADTYVLLAYVKGKENSETTLKPSDIPPTITKLRQYFDPVFPNSAGRNLNPGIRLAFNGNQTMITKNME